MKEFLNSQGSCWRRWDLHIHSPESVLHNEFGDNWETYIEALERLDDISVVGITDYYSIEGYKKVKQYQSDGRIANLDLVVPNVELRLDKATMKGKAVNIHVIFDPEVEDLIERYFLEELEFRYNDEIYKCTKRDLIQLGENFLNDDTYSEKKALREGMMQFKVSIEGLREIFNKHQKRFKDKYIIVLPNSNHDGNSGIKGDSFKGVRREIYRFAHAIFSGNPSDRKFFLGESDWDATIEQCGKIMPCIHGSDAHKLENIGKPDKNRYTWIKAEPSFQGLLQILHEPKGRVMIQEEHPDNKNDYDVIEAIKFIESEEFTDKEIKLNSGLNTVIGGKSSGKSLLLYKIAQAISQQEIETREKEDLWKNPYKKTFIESTKLQVRWRNGECSYSDDGKIGKVTYIPQMYINSLSEDTANDVLQDKIREILLQNGENRNFWDSKKSEGIRLKNGLSSKVATLFENIRKSEELESQIINIGNLDAITKEKEKLHMQVEEKIKAANLTEEDEEAINIKEQTKEQINQQIVNINKSKERADELSEHLSVAFELVNDKLKGTISRDDDLAQLIDELRLAISNAFVNAQSQITEKVQQYEIEERKHDEELDEVNQELTPLLEKLRGINEIQSLKVKMEEQDGYIKQIEAIEEEKKALGIVLSSIKEEILQNVSNMFALKIEIASYFNSQTYFQDIKLNAFITFDSVGFEERFLSMFNRRGRLNRIFPGCDEQEIFNEDAHFIFNEENYIRKLEFLFETILTQDESKLRRGYSKQQAIEYLLDAYTSVVFDLERDEDTLTQMSPGKRGLVLLELFLDMSNEKHPILIDQPEDNLDNRTISTDLVKFIKEKSPQRQIIVVTHNANLVVLTDSENVIVANQDVQLNENESHRFEYITGALECDFVEKGSKKLAGKGIKSHACEILEGGREAFEMREKKYGF
ncbi:TrlF family AAA-like ATPase [Bacillus toyonensis]|uniref:TrlF family AAA-like ATPase n=1 Tax=Bacillus toyonensis TaxID=155322 RepID=UPI00124D67FB|nr:ATP-binding protein [Bacillus toyonensis]KAB2357035.1 hypothetical protein F8503_23170 [Bacillus toyonensis]